MKKLGRVSLENIDEILDSAERVYAIEQFLTTLHDRGPKEFREASGYPPRILERLFWIGRKASVLRSQRELLPKSINTLDRLGRVDDDSEIVSILQLNLNAMTDNEVGQLFVNRYWQSHPTRTIVTIDVPANTPDSKIMPLLQDIMDSAFMYGDEYKIDVGCSPEVHWETPEDEAKHYGVPVEEVWEPEIEQPSLSDELRQVREHSLNH